LPFHFKPAWFCKKNVGEGERKLEREREFSRRKKVKGKIKCKNHQTNTSIHLSDSVLGCDYSIKYANNQQRMVFSNIYFGHSTAQYIVPFYLIKVESQIENKEIPFEDKQKHWTVSYICMSWGDTIIHW